MIELPLKFKKQIIDFTIRYQDLARPRKIKAIVPTILTVSWTSDDKLDVNDSYIDSFLKIPKIFQENKKIKDFCKETVDFGRKYFKDRDWLWKTILWNFKPEQNQKYNFKKVKWIKNYEI